MQNIDSSVVQNKENVEKLDLNHLQTQFLLQDGTPIYILNSNQDELGNTVLSYIPTDAATENTQSNL